MVRVAKMTKKTGQIIAPSLKEKKDFDGFQEKLLLNK